MNKMVKASVVGAAGVSLLMGGFGTYALWHDSAGTGAGTSITSGVLDVNAGLRRASASHPSRVISAFTEPTSGRAQSAQGAPSPPHHRLAAWQRCVVGRPRWAR